MEQEEELRKRIELSPLKNFVSYSILASGLSKQLTPLQENNIYFEKYREKILEVPNAPNQTISN